MDKNPSTVKLSILITLPLFLGGCLSLFGSNNFSEFTSIRKNETLTMGDEIDIYWRTHEQPEEIILEYDAENQWNTMGTLIPNSGSWSWMVPSHISQKSKFRLSTSSHEVLMESASFYLIDPWQVYLEKRVWDMALKDESLSGKAFEFTKNNPDLPDILLIGNSISIGYTPFVRDQLENIANVYRIPGNARDTRHGLNKMNLWLGHRQWDIIHFNFGLHDLEYTGSKIRTGKTQFRDNLELIIQKLKSTGAELVWATISTVPAGSPGRVKGDEVIYNDIAREVLKAYPEIPKDEQYQLTARYPDEQIKNDVHFTPEGYRRQARQVADRILYTLKKRF